jgi:hypothetical protein
VYGSSRVRGVIEMVHPSLKTERLNDAPIASDNMIDDEQPLIVRHNDTVTYQAMFCCSIGGDRG